MNWLSFISEMTKALAWPVAVVTILAIYRKTFPNLIERMRSFKYGNFEAGFAEQSILVAENISSAPRSLTSFESADEKLLQLAKQSPRAAVIEAWLRIEARLMEMSSQTGGKQEKHFNLTELIRVLRNGNAISSETEHALRGLMQLRNLAVHAPEEKLSIQKAVDFITLAGALQWTLSVLPSN